MGKRSLITAWQDTKDTRGIQTLLEDRNLLVLDNWPAGFKNKADEKLLASSFPGVSVYDISRVANMTNLYLASQVRMRTVQDKSCAAVLNFPTVHGVNLEETIWIERSTKDEIGT